MKIKSPAQIPRACFQNGWSGRLARPGRRLADRNGRGCQSDPSVRVGCGHPLHSVRGVAVQNRLVACATPIRLFKQALAAILAFFALASSLSSAQALGEISSNPYAAWKNGPSSDPNFFPIAVWLQAPKNAARYKAAGINLYVGLWRGPTPDQLSELEKAGMRVICGQNRSGLENKDNPVIVGWMHGDEPDNAQSLGQGKGYGPPILPETIVRNYEKLRQADPSRPVLLNLGQGVAYDNYIGRGVRRNHPEDYPEYLKGCDIPSFDIYPVVHDKPEVAGKLEFVPKGVERLVRWTGGAKPVWNCIECTRISNLETKATPAQVRSEVWMALIHGSRGLIYFVHQFKPTFNEAALLDDPEMLAGVTAINRQIHELAPVLNSPTLTNGVAVKSSAAAVPCHSACATRTSYLFAVVAQPIDARSFRIRNLPKASGSSGRSRELCAKRRIHRRIQTVRSTSTVFKTRTPNEP